MAKFLLHLYQGNGCDYTISCGETTEEFEANNEKEIKENVKEKIEYYGRDNIDKVTLYEIINNYGELNIKDLFAQDDAEEATSKKAEEEAKEKEILRKLKEKYPDA